MKILIHNTGYFLGHSGAPHHYLMRGHRYLACGQAISQQSLDRFAQLIATHQPDICGLLEAEPRHLHSLQSAYRFRVVGGKYQPECWWNQARWTRRKGNAVLANAPLPIRHHYLSNGTKRLVLEAEIAPQTSLFLVHLSLRPWVRRQQLLELGSVLAASSSRHRIVAGDFNCFGGYGELHDFAKRARLRPVTTAAMATFPAHRPRHALDAVFASPGVSLQAQVLPESCSDHRPLLVELDAAAR